MHSLRHSHGGHLLSEAIPITTVSKRLGHSSVAHHCSAIYSHSFTRDEIAGGGLGEAMRQVVSPTRRKDVARQ